MNWIKSYPLAASYWTRSEMIQIYDVNNNRLCTIPIAFLQASKDLDWHFVSYCIRACVETEGILVSSANAEGTAVDFDSPVVPGKYFFHRQDDMFRPITLRWGPISRQGSSPPVSGAEGSETTPSSLKISSSRYSSDQRQMTVALIGRDYCCLVTGEHYMYCKAAHIVPYSRPDILEVLLGYADEWRFHPWMGILLAEKIHIAYDAYRISIYPRANDWVVHVFDDPTSDLLQYHGKSISPLTFRGPKQAWPRKELLLWHHQQCVQKHLRGYSHSMTPADEIESPTTMNI